MWFFCLFVSLIRLWIKRGGTWLWGEWGWGVNDSQYCKYKTVAIRTGGIYYCHVCIVRLFFSPFYYYYYYCSYYDYYSSLTISLLLFCSICMTFHYNETFWGLFVFPSLMMMMMMWVSGAGGGSVWQGRLKGNFTSSQSNQNQFSNRLFFNKML